MKDKLVILKTFGVLLFLFFLLRVIYVIGERERNRESLNGIIKFNKGEVVKIADTLKLFIEGDNFRKNIIIVNVKGKYGLYDTINKVNLTEIKYDEIGYYSSQKKVDYRLNEKYGFLNNSGEEIIPAIYDFAGRFSLGLAPVEKDGKWGYINIKGETIIPFQFESAFYFITDWSMASVEKGGKWGYINVKGETIIPFEFDYNNGYNSYVGLAAVKKDGKWGYINAKGEYVLASIYDNITLGFGKEKIANVTLKGNDVFIDVKGNVIRESEPYTPFK